MIQLSIQLVLMTDFTNVQRQYCINHRTDQTIYLMDETRIRIHCKLFWLIHVGEQEFCLKFKKACLKAALKPSVKIQTEE